MKNPRVTRSAILPCLAALIPTAAIGALAVTAPVRPALHALAAKARAALAPAPVTASGPATVRLTDFAGGDSASLLKLQGSVFAARGTSARSRVVGPRATTSDPVTLQAYGSGEVVHITNASGQVVRAPQSATDTSIAPNQPLTFTVRVNNSTASTQATAVYIQIKDPDSIYDDTNLSGDPREHKVFAEDNYTRNNLPSLNHPNFGYTFDSNVTTNPVGPNYYGVPGDFADNPGRAAVPPPPAVTNPPTVPAPMTMPPAYFGATPADNLLDPEQDTSGTAASKIFNGYGNYGGFYDNTYELPYQSFPQQNYTQYIHLRGMVGGRDASNPTTQFITLGRVDPAGFNTLNPIFQDGPNNSRIRLPGPDPGDFDNPSVDYSYPTTTTTTTGGMMTSNTTYTPVTDYGVFRAVGQEYECQYLNAHDQNPDPAAAFDPNATASGFTNGSDAADSDYGDPYYLAGVDDQNGAGTSRTEWLALHPVAGSPDLYSATWAPPFSPSDFYVDVIVYDNQSNFRIYDNVWGFSTLPFQANNDILLVMDNALGQKYAASALAGSGGLANLRPFFYGAESSFTATDITKLPNATIHYVTAANPASIYRPPYTTTVAAGVNNQPSTNGITSTFGLPIISYFGYSPARANSFNLETPQNGLGYHSYGDGSSDDNDGILSRNPQVTATGTSSSGDTTVGPVLVPQSQSYSLWRILCRGPVPTALYQDPPHPANAQLPSGYAPDALVTQPAISDPTTGFQAPTAVVPVATRCIVWVSPFTGDQPLEIPGSLDSTATQAQLQQFVAGGGRLFITGQEVATALTHEGSTPFLNNVLNASLVSDGSGLNGVANNQILNGQNGIGHFLSFDSFFDFQGPFTFDDVYSAFLEQNPSGIDPYVAPGASPLLICNNYARALDSGTYDNWRTDASLTQEGPYVQPFGTAQVQSRISTVNPMNGATADFSFNNGGNAAMIWHTDSTDAVGSGFGSKVVFASFGLEGLGNDYFHRVNNGVDYYFPHDQRTRILHNIVSYLRTGTFTGRIFLGTSNSLGVAGATVYLVPFPNSSASHTIPNQARQAYSTITSDGTDGNPVGYYKIQGLEPGAYRVIAYKTGYTTDASPLDNESGDIFAVAGDTSESVNLNITQLPPGTISGTVKFSDGTPAPRGTPVTFVAADGTTASGATTDASGDYSVIANADTYNGTATTTNPSATGTVSNITVPINSSGGAGAATANFILSVNPGTITGSVTRGGTGVGGATVTFTPVPASAGSVQTAITADGTGGTTLGAYTSPSLPAGTYTVIATDTIGGVSYVSATVTATVAAGAATPNINLALQAAQSVPLSGFVTNAATSAGVSNATITVTSGSGATATTVATAATGANSATGAYPATGTLLVPQGVYTVTASATGYVSQTQTLTISATQTSAVLNFSLTAQTPITAGYTAGSYNLVSWPNEYSPTTGNNTAFSDIYGPLITTSNTGGDRGPAYIYNSAAHAYTVEPTAPADGLHLGRGYFVYLRNVNPVFSLLGTAPTGSTVPVPLQGGGIDGWNMIGVPSTTAISVSNLSFQFQYPNGTVVPAGSAVSDGYIYGFGNGSNATPTVYGYNPSSNSYSIVTQMQPFQGYWIRAKVSGMTALIPTGGG